jgi:hypothetical protein
MNSTTVQPQTLQGGQAPADGYHLAVEGGDVSESAGYALAKAIVVEIVRGSGTFRPT